MCLKIVNFEFGQKLHFNLPLIIGKLPNLCAHSLSSNCDSNCLSQVFCILNQTRRFQVQAVHGQFRMLIHLSKGTNQLEFVWSRQTRKSLLFELQFELPNSDNELKLLYVTCASSQSSNRTRFESGHFQSPCHLRSDVIEAKNKISLAGLMLQSFMIQSRLKINKKNKHQLITNTFKLNLNENDMPKVELIHLNDSADKLFSLNETELWTLLARHLIQTNLTDSIKYLAFCSFTRYNFNPTNKDEAVLIDDLNYDNLVQMIQGWVCMGGGSLAMISGCSLFTWPSQLEQVISKFQDETKIDRTRWFDDSGNNESTFGGVYANTLGSAMHELGHVFDLGHAQYGVMGRGFEKINCFFDVKFHLLLKEKNKHSNLNCFWWHRSSLAILANHRFLHLTKSIERKDQVDFWCSDQNQNLNFQISQTFSDCNFRFDENQDSIWSRFGVRLIDFRNVNSETLFFYCFSSPQQIIRLEEYENFVNSASVLIMDCNGNCFKMET